MMKTIDFNSSSSRLLKPALITVIGFLLLCILPEQGYSISINKENQSTPPKYFLGIDSAVFNYFELWKIKDFPSKSSLKANYNTRDKACEIFFFRQKGHYYQINYLEKELNSMFIDEKAVRGEDFEMYMPIISKQLKKFERRQSFYAKRQAKRKANSIAHQP